MVFLAGYGCCLLYHHYSHTIPILSFIHLFIYSFIHHLSAGWTPFHLYKGSTERDRNLNQTKLNGVLKTLLDKVRNSIHATYFRMPIAVAGSRSSAAASASAGVGTEGLPVTDPIDLSVITNRLRLNDYYRNRDMMKHDLLRMVRGYFPFKSLVILMSQLLFVEQTTKSYFPIPNYLLGE